MKYITAVLRKTLVGDVIHSLGREGFCVLSVCDVSVVADLHDPRDEHISFTYEGHYTRMSRLELICGDDEAEHAMGILKSHGHTDHRGDGFVLVWPVERAAGLRTGQEGLQVFQFCKEEIK